MRFYTYAGVVHAVSQAYLDVFEGETVALVGETGCGKSVFTKAITGLIAPPGCSITTLLDLARAVFKPFILDFLFLCIFSPMKR
ncbi:MAG: ATP-binding cassette domain-containing protein [Thermofilum sp.]|nr:ATP-binding cassette domain-containing protein [Thermofilum sp.]